MAGYVEILPRTYVGTGATVISDVVDCGGAAFVAINGLLDGTTTGSAGPPDDRWIISVDHSNVNEQQTFVDSGAGSLTLTATDTFLYVTQFGRYIRVKLTTSASVVPAFIRIIATLKDSN